MKKILGCVLCLCLPGTIGTPALASRRLIFVFELVAFMGGFAYNEGRTNFAMGNGL